jgi:DNA-binding helix-hairpin-helix protein with protein kinase domain
MSVPQPKSGLRIYTSDDRELILDQEIGRGGEGSVWSISGTTSIAAKFYHQTLAAAQARKIETMCRVKSESLLRIAAWPIATLSTKVAGEPEGLLMPRINGYRAAHLLYNPKSRRSAFPEAQFPFILHSAINVARAFATIHDAGQVIGDVNHGNLLVSANGIVALIDCDSFQITDRGDVYRCLVCVPEYTPPELQGKNFQTLLRTRHHDAFGLAVLIFHMLFLGRHPFAGIYDNGAADITIEQAISEYRFAYSPDTSLTKMQPPPSAPRLAEFTPAIANLFLRSFTTNGGPVLRPSAHEWIAALESAAHALKQCVANPSHQYFNHISACPWCRVEAMVGIPMFGITVVVVHDEQFDIKSIWAKIDVVQPARRSGATQPHQPFSNTCSVAPNIQTIISSRSRMRIASLTVMAFAILVVGAEQPGALYSIIILAAALFGAAKMCQQGSIGARGFKLEHENARRDYNVVLDEWTKSCKVPDSFLEEKQRLANAKLALENLPSIRAQKMAQLSAGARQKQLQRFLESHRLEDAVLQNIGKGRKQLLRVYNIEDASDVEPSRISGIKGFGPTMQRTLLAWRASIEQQFRFDPSKGIAPEDLRQVQQELQQKRAESVRALMAGPQQLTFILQQWDARALNSETKLSDTAKRLAQAQLNVGALGYWHWRVEYLVLLFVIALLGSLLWFWPRTLPIQPYTPRHFGKAGPRSAYPDPLRTPGATNPAVSQANLGRTICNPAWSAKNLRLSESFTRALKLRQMREWGIPGSPNDYEEDHLISMDLGGHPADSHNLWPQPYKPSPGAAEKDVVERYLHGRVCDGKMSLTDAQSAIIGDWYLLYFLITGDERIGGSEGTTVRR